MNKVRSFGLHFLITALILLASFAVSQLIQQLYPTQRLVPMLFLLAVFLISLITRSYFWGIAASFGSMFILNFAFTFPYYAFDFSVSENLFSAVVMLAVAMITSTLTTRIKEQETVKAESQKEKMRANLLRAVSHDLRTPLTTIYGACSAIIDNYDTLTREQQLRLLGEVCEDAQSLTRMVENLLSVTRINSDSVRIAKEDTVLEELIDTTLVKFRKQYPSQEVQVQIPEDFVSIPMDAMLIQQVLLNLLENAALHASGMENLCLTVTLDGKFARFQVQDDGCGIPKARLADPFGGYIEGMHRPDDGSRQGMGIGLSVCASIIKAHGGRITAENNPGGGAAFTFWLETEEGTHGE